MGKIYGDIMKRETAIMAILSLMMVSTIVLVGTDVQAQQNIEFRGLKVNSKISNNYHICNITADVANPGDRLLETVFSFDIPENGMLTEMTVEINGTTYRSEIKEKEEAKDDYDQAVARGDSAFLLERALKWNQFTFSLGLEPGADASLTVKYGQVMKMYLGAYDLEIPLSSISDYKDFDQVDVRIEGELEGLEELNTDRSTIILERTREDADGFLLEYSSDQPSGDDDVFVTYKVAKTPEDGMMRSSVYNGEGYFMHIFSPDVDSVGTYMPKDIVIVLDKSGSMSGAKIQTVKSSFSGIVDQFSEDDRFNIILFDTATSSFWDSPTQATETRRSEANRYIQNIDANGGTNIGAGLTEGIDQFSEGEYRVPVLIFLTDGLPTAGVQSTQQLRTNVKESNQHGAVIHTLGYGPDHDANFLKAVALENEGEYRYIMDGSDAAELLLDQYSSVSSPIFKDLKFNYSSTAHDVFGDTVSVLFEGSEVVVIGKYNLSEPTLEMELDAKYQGGDRIITETYELTDEDEGDVIPKLWAHSKISSLLDEIFVEGENESKVDEIVSLALEHSFVTPYTSFVLVVDEKEDVDEKEETDMDTSQVTESDGLKDTGEVDLSDPASAPNFSYGGGAGAPCFDTECEEDGTMMFVIFPLLFLIAVGAVIAVIVIVVVAISRRGKRSEMENENID